MGLNINLHNLKIRKDFPDWDYIRQGDDRLFAHLLDDGFPVTAKKLTESYLDMEIYYRPSDYSAWIEIINRRDLQPKERYEKLLNILRNNEDVWIHVSY